MGRASIEDALEWLLRISAGGEGLNSEIYITVNPNSQQYDPATIQDLAQKLCARAQSAIWIYPLSGLFLGFIIGVGIGGSARMPLAPLICAGGFCIIGVFVGVERAALLRLQAQAALCQAKIESHARKLRDA